MSPFGYLALGALCVLGVFGFLILDYPALALLSAGGAFVSLIWAEEALRKA